MKMNEERIKALNEFIEYKKATITTQKKILDLTYYIRQFLAYSDTPLKAYNENDLVKYLQFVNRKYSIGTANGLKIYVRNFLRWFYPDHSQRFRNLDKLCRSLKVPATYQPDQMLNEKDVQALIQHEHDLSWKAYFLLFFYGGFRPSECCKLKWQQITYENEGAFIKTFSKKNNRTFNKFIPADVVFYINKIKNGSEWLFPSKSNYKKGKNEPIGEKAVYHRLRKLSLKALGKRINPYIIRHSVGTLLYSKDEIKDTYIAQQLGHAKSMRETYTHMNDEAQKSKLRPLWLKPEDLPPQKKNELEEVKAQLQALQDYVKKEIIESRREIEIGTLSKVLTALQPTDRRKYNQLKKEIESIN